MEPAVPGVGETVLGWAMVVAAVAAMVVSLVVVDASIGHDGFHCELGIRLHATDDSCGGAWR